MTFNEWSPNAVRKPPWPKREPVEIPWDVEEDVADLDVDAAYEREQARSYDKSREDHPEEHQL